MKEKYKVKLSLEERAYLEGLVNKGKVAAHKRRHAQILLKADIGEAGPGWQDAQIMEALDVSRSSVERVRKKLVMEGLDAALNRTKGDRSRTRKLDGEQEAHLIALSCSEPPEGKSKWTLQLLADRMVALNHVESLSYETVRRTLKKTK